MEYYELWSGGPKVQLPDSQDRESFESGRPAQRGSEPVQVDLGNGIGLVNLFQGVQEVGKLGYNALMNNSIGGGLEVGAQMGTGFAAAGIGAVQGANDAMMANGQNTYSEPFRTPTGLGGYEPRQSPRAEGLSPGDAYLSGFGDAAEKYTFQPRTEAGKEIIGDIEEAYVEHIQEAWGDEWVGRLVDEGHITPEIATTLRTMPDAAALFLGLKIKHIPGVVRSMGAKAAEASGNKLFRAEAEGVAKGRPAEAARTLAIGPGESMRGGPKAPAPVRPQAPVENNLVPRPISELEIAKSQRGGRAVIPPRRTVEDMTPPMNPNAVDMDLIRFADKTDPNIARAAMDLLDGRPLRPRIDPDIDYPSPSVRAEQQTLGRRKTDVPVNDASNAGALTEKLVKANKNLSAIFPKQRGGPKPPSTTDKHLQKLDDAFARVSQLTLESENFLKEVLGDEWSWVRVEQQGDRSILTRDTADGVDPTMDQLRQRAFREGLEPEQFIESVAKLRLRVQEAWDEMGRLGDARDRLIAADRGRGFNDPKVDVAGADKTNVTPINNLAIGKKQRGAIGWHGSTHGRLEAVPEGKTTNNIEDLFSLKNVGTGTGAQVEGFGLYFAPSAGEVRSFRVMAENGWEPAQRKAITERFAKDYPDALTDEGVTVADLMKGDEHQVRRIIDDYTANPGRNKALQADRNGFRKWYDKQGGAGHEFEVDVPDSVIARMIDADQPLANQPESVKVGLRQLFDQYDGTDFDAYAARGNDWKDARNNLLEELDESEKSQMLLEVGIPGVRYFGDSVRGAAKVGEQIGSREKDLLNKMIEAEKAGKPDLVKKLQKKLDGLEAESFAKPNLVLFDPQVIASVKRDGKVVYAGGKKAPAGYTFEPDPVEEQMMAYRMAAEENRSYVPATTLNVPDGFSQDTKSLVKSIERRRDLETNDPVDLMSDLEDRMYDLDENIGTKAAKKESEWLLENVYRDLERISDQRNDDLKPAKDAYRAQKEEQIFGTREGKPIYESEVMPDARKPEDMAIDTIMMEKSFLEKQRKMEARDKANDNYLDFVYGDKQGVRKNWDEKRDTPWIGIINKDGRAELKNYADGVDADWHHSEALSAEGYDDWSSDSTLRFVREFDGAGSPNEALVLGGNAVLDPRGAGEQQIRLLATKLKEAGVPGHYELKGEQMHLNTPYEGRSLGTIDDWAISKREPKYRGDPNQAVYEGDAYRAPGFEDGAPPGATAADVVLEEMERKGIATLDEFGIDDATFEALKNEPADSLMWVGRSKNALMDSYGPTEHYAGLIDDPKNISNVTDTVSGKKILYEDPDGALVHVGPKPGSRNSLAIGPGTKQRGGPKFTPKQQAAPTIIGDYKTTTSGRIRNKTMKDGGYTVDLNTGDVPDTGIMVGKFPNENSRTVVLEGKVTKQDLVDFARSNEKELKKVATYLGTWKNDDKIYLDIARRFESNQLRKSTKYGESTGQDAVYDLLMQQEHPVGNWKEFINSGEFTERMLEMEVIGRKYLKEHGGEWWDIHKTLFETVYGEKNLNIVAGYIASTAPMSDPTSNVQVFSEYMRRHIVGEPIIQPDWRVPANAMKRQPGSQVGNEASRKNNLMRSSRGELNKLQRDKVNQEAKALMGDPEAQVLDRWWSRIGEKPSEGIYTSGKEGNMDGDSVFEKDNYPFMAAAVRPVAAMLKETPRNFTANVWTGMRETVRWTGELFGVKYGKRPQGESKGYKDIFEDLIEAKAEHLGMSKGDFMKELGKGKAELLSLLIATPFGALLLEQLLSLADESENENNLAAPQSGAARRSGT